MHTITHTDKNNTSPINQICLKKVGGSCSLPKFLPNPSPGQEEEDPGDKQRSTLGGCLGTKWAFTHLSPMQLWPQLTSLCTPRFPALPYEHQIQFTHPLAHSLSPTHAQKSKALSPARHRMLSEKGEGRGEATLCAIQRVLGHSQASSVR